MSRTINSGANIALAAVFFALWSALAINGLEAAVWRLTDRPTGNFADDLVQPLLASQPFPDMDDSASVDSLGSGTAGGQPATTPPPTPFSFLGSSRPVRLARAPNMFGDSFGLGGHLVVFDIAGLGPATTDLPLAGGSRRAKAAENNSALPRDRIFVLYNHFHSSLEFDPFFTPIRDFSIDRCTLGLEKTFCEGIWSLEFRLPFASEMESASALLSVEGGEVGNLALLLKRLIYEDCQTAVAIGLGIDVPTGDDVRGVADVNPYVLKNDATHLLPYVGLLHAPSDVWFFQAFLQVDVTLNGNRVILPAPGTLLGKLNEETLLYLDGEVGCWLYRDHCACRLTGLAAVAEVHYTSSLQDFDTVSDGAGLTTFRSSANAIDVVNFTLGLHGEFANNTLLRIGGVFPASGDRDSQFFDSEVQVQVERRY